MIFLNIAALSNTDLTTFFLALILLLLFAHCFGYVFQRLSMPKVIGEIVGGLLLVQADRSPIRVGA